MINYPLFSAEHSLCLAPNPCEGRDPVSFTPRGGGQCAPNFKGQRGRRNGFNHCTCCMQNKPNQTQFPSRNRATDSSKCANQEMTRRRRIHPESRFTIHERLSKRNVTGPSLTLLTSICPPNTPRSTATPLLAIAATNAS